MGRDRERRRGREQLNPTKSSVQNGMLSPGRGTCPLGPCCLVLEDWQGRQKNEAFIAIAARNGSIGITNLTICALLFPGKSDKGTKFLCS